MSINDGTLACQDFMFYMYCHIRYIVHTGYVVVFSSAYVVVEAMCGQLAGDTFQPVVYMSPLHLAWYQSHELGIQFICVLP